MCVGGAERNRMHIHSSLNENLILVGVVDLFFFFLDGMKKHREGLFIDYWLLLRAMS